MASSAVHVSLDEYLHTEYEPDCEYVDGALEDRNVGKKRHSKTQSLLSAWLLAKAGEHGYDVLVGQRVKISSSRVRIPDICLVPKDDPDEVVQQPPALWIEILSPEDRWSRIQTKLAEILRFGVNTVWIIDPYSNKAWIATSKHVIAEAEDGKLRCASPQLELDLAEILPE